jgi:hypothetical protein
MSAPVILARQMVAVLSTALADLSMPVERQRTEPLAKDDLPRVLVHEDEAGAEAEFIGGASMRYLRFTVECVVDGATPVAAQDAAIVLRERVRAALEGNRLLYVGVLLAPGFISPRLVFSRAQAAGVQATTDDLLPLPSPPPAPCLGLFVGPAEIRTELPEATNARAAAMSVTCYHV